MRSLIVLMAVASVGVPASIGSGECSAADSWIGGCNNTGTEIIIDGSRPGAETPGTSPIGDWDHWEQEDGDSTPWVPPEEQFSECLAEWDSYLRCYESIRDDDVAPEDDEVPAIPAVTITDLVRFAPAGSVITGEPDNVGVAGLPTNFVTTASVQIVDASLFGFPVSVRFTPSAYDFSFGDGATATTSAGGTTWASLGQAQFTPTDTSHTYRERGTYIAQADVRYTAEVDFGVGWFPITGEVTSAGAPQDVRIFEAHTALVAHTCEQAPRSPGC